MLVWYTAEIKEDNASVGSLVSGLILRQPFPRGRKIAAEVSYPHYQPQPEGTFFSPLKSHSSPGRILIGSANRSRALP